MHRTIVAIVAIVAIGVVLAGATALADTSSTTHKVGAAKKVTTFDACADFGQGFRQCSAGTANPDVQGSRRSWERPIGNGAAKA